MGIRTAIYTQSLNSGGRAAQRLNRPFPLFHDGFCLLLLESIGRCDPRWRAGSLIACLLSLADGIQKVQTIFPVSGLTNHRKRAGQFSETESQ